MEKYSIFYSWQSDLDPKYNRSYIEDCLKKALKNLNKSEEFLIEYSLDRDTKGEAGTPDIVSTIFKKISNANIFICDISIINSNTEGRKVSNPNVLLELGYAAANIGWENMICVFNKSYGNVEELPFDLRFRRPLQYDYNENSSKDTEALVKQLEQAIKLSHPDNIEVKKKIRKAYKYESDKALKIAIEKPSYWKFKLCEELFIYKLKEVNKKFENVENETAFRKGRSVESTDFFGILADEMGYIVRTINAITTVFRDELMKALGSDDAIEILQAINKLFKLLDNFIDSEIELRSMEVDEICEESQTLCFGITKQMVESFNSVPEQFQKIYLYPNSMAKHTIEVVFDSPKNHEAIMEKIAYFRKYPHLLKK